MLKNNQLINKTVNKMMEDEAFSGVIYMKNAMGDNFVTVAGYSDRSEQITNDVHTRFGIASGCKLFTAIAIGQLVEKGLLSFETYLKDCLDLDFPNIDHNVTVHHLLSHSSGIPDYFDEEVMDDFEDLWKMVPMYLLKELKDFLPMFQDKEMMFQPGDKFHYNNAGYIVLGLIIEQTTGLRFTDYIETNVFKRCGMTDSGYFSLDNLPKNTALGYIDEKDGRWRTNTFAIPIKGGSDGGAYVTAPDMNKLWDGLFSHKLMNEPITNKFLTPQISVKTNVHYGYGIWMNNEEDQLFKYYVMGYDPGVSFHSAVYPTEGITLTIPSNKSAGPLKIMKAIEEEMKSV